MIHYRKSGKALFIFLIFSNFFSFGQDMHEQERQWKHLVNISPLKLIEPEGSIQIGYQRIFKERYALQADISYLFNSYYRNYKAINYYSTSVEGYKGAIEIRRYFYSKKKDIYTGIDFFTKFMLFRGLSSNIRGAVFVSEEKIVHASHVKLGYQFYFRKRGVLDLYSGLGARWRSRSISERTSNGTYDSQLILQPLPSAMLGLRIGWIL